MNFYAYVYRDPRPEKNLEPIYVGKGTGSRSNIHLYDCKNKYLSRKLQKIKILGLSPHIEIINAIDELHALFLESCLIQVFGRRDLKTGTLVNLTDGGEGVSGLKHSQETKLKMSIAKRGISPYNKGISLSPEQKQKISFSLTGKKASEFTKAKMSNARIGKKLPPRSKDHCEKLAIAQRGKKASAETKAKMSASHKAR